MFHFLPLQLQFYTLTQTCTLPEDLMPLNMARQTMTQARTRQPVMIRLNSPTSLMESVISRALRNQKYDVGELAAHSGTTHKDTHTIRSYIHDLQFSDSTAQKTQTHLPVVFPSLGQFSHGKGLWNDLKR